MGREAATNTASRTRLFIGRNKFGSKIRKCKARLRPRQLAILDPMRLVRVLAAAAAEILQVGGIVAGKPMDGAVALERKNMGGHPIEEPAVVGDDQRAAG